MGQAKQRGSREERIAQAHARAEEAPKFRTQGPAQATMPQSFAEVLQLKARADRLFAGLTTPTQINEQVEQFAQTLSDQPPMFLDCRPEPWSRQSCCDANVAKYIESHGGRMLCGYRIWYNEPLYIEGERHAVWTDGEEILDVSFVDTGETTILFLPDGYGFDDAPPKVRFAFDESDKETLAQFETVERAMPVSRLAPQAAWDTMLTYEQWLIGERMPNMFPAFK